MDEILTSAIALKNLGAVLEWAFQQQPPYELIKVVTQDEYTHDVIIQVAEKIFLVFDTN
jgi:hypothetical protein